MARRAALVLAIAISGAFGTSLARAEEQREVADPAPAPESSAQDQLTRPPAPMPAYQPAPADPEPSTGIGAIVPGWIFFGTGGAILAAIPLFYYLNDVERRVPPDDLKGSILIGVVGVGVGIPLLVYGYVQRSNHKAWARRNVGVLNTQVFIGKDAAFVGYSTSF